MGRKKLIETEKLINLAERYIKESCGDDLNKFKIAKFSRHLKEIGLLINEPVIRRNEDFMKHFSDKKKAKKAVIEQQNVVYERINVDEMISSGISLAAIKVAINNREDYYKLVYDSFVEMKEKLKVFKKEYKKMKRENDELKAQLILMEEKLSAIKTVNHELKEQTSAYKEQIEGYVYPSIAMEIIKTIEPALVKETPGLINPDVVVEKTADVDTDLFKNPLINDLYRASEKA